MVVFSLLGVVRQVKGGYINPCLPILSSTAIGLRKYRIPSDLRSQAEYRLVSTTVGDHVGILGAVVFVFALSADY